MSIGTVVPLHVCVDTPVIGSESFLNDKRIGVGVPWDVMEEPSWEGVRNMVSINA